MSFGKSKSKQSSQQASSGTSTTTVDPWAKAQFENQTKGILDLTTNYTSKPFESYTKPMVAGLSPTEMAARDMISAGAGSGGILDDATAAAKAGGASVAGPQAVNYRTYNSGDEGRFFNPYEAEVVGATGAFFDEELARQLNQHNDAVTQRGAFGNVSRDFGEAELRRLSTMDRAQALADLKYRGFTDSMDRLERENANVYGADVRNSDVDYAARSADSTRKMQEAGILGGLASQKDATWAQQATMLANFGANEREIEQARLLADRAEFDREAKDELDRFLLELQVRQGILGSTPYGTTTTSSGTGNSSGTSSSTNMGLSFGWAPSPTMAFGG